MRPEVCAPQAPRVLVLLCGDLETQGEGLDLSAITTWMANPSGLQVRTERELCRRLGQVAIAADGAERLVLGLCSRDFSQTELQAWARKAGLDPFGVEVANLGLHCSRAHSRREATAKARLLLEAAVARARAFAGSGPDNVKPVLSWTGQVSRRALFSLPPIFYQPVPSIRRAECAAEGGCRMCAQVCPQEALVPDQRGMRLDKARCTACGACLSVCPRTAIDLPGASLQQIEAQLATLLDMDALPLGARGILILCAGGTQSLERLVQCGSSYPAGWLPVEVPSLAMVTPAWILACLARGAAVGLLPCSRQECCLGQQALIQGRVDYCQQLLRLLPWAGPGVKLLDPQDESRLARDLRTLAFEGVGHPSRRPQGMALASPRASAQAILEMAGEAGIHLAVRLDHPHSPLGVVRVREEGCTGCEACARACPTGALSFAREGNGVALAFDARLCVACMACAPVCPERVLRVERVTDLAHLSQGESTLFHDSEPRCDACGAPIAPRALLQRLQVHLADQPAIAATITRHCASCRGLPLAENPAGAECCQVR